jgi:lipopolysaccharide transport system ATP-binding protein
MSGFVISVQHLGKRYTVNRQPFWALRDITVDVARGDVLGIVGRNGAGKTTLLRVLAQITDPTEGRAVLRGRIGTLLETGTGFHEDLSGRENVYLNGALLGMKPPEIRRRFDEIVEFSGVAKFIDSAVKSYSSGMRSRLAFSIAAHLDTEILLVDEVLAVGDLAFQEKCLRKMDQLTRSGERTVLFVSHSMGAVQSLCNRAILIEEGRIHTRGTTEEVVQAYHQLMLGPQGETDLRAVRGRPGSGSVRLVQLRLENLEGRSLSTVPAGGGFRLLLDYESELTQRPRDVIINVAFLGSKGFRLFDTSTEVVRADLTAMQGRGSFVCTIPKLPLLPGLYDLDIGCMVDRELADKVVNLCQVAVGDSDYYGTGRMPPTSLCDVMLDYRWHLEPAAGAVPAPEQAVLRKG